MTTIARARLAMACMAASALIGCGDDSPRDPANDSEACPLLDAAQVPNAGLYTHRIEYSTSTDAVHFTHQDAVLLEHASVPDAVVRPDGAIWVYYINANPGQHAVFIAEFDRANERLVPFDCVRIDGKVNGNAVDPDVVRLADGRYRLHVFEGWFVSPPPPGQPPHAFYAAVSEDGIHFTTEAKVLETEGGGTDPTVAQASDGTWVLAVTHDSEGVIVATSRDPIAPYTRTGDTFPGGIPELAAFEDGSVRLYVAGMDGFRVYRTTDAAETWTLEQHGPGGGADPSLIHNPDGTYTLFTKSFDAPPPR